MNDNVTFISDLNGDGAAGGANLDILKRYLAENGDVDDSDDENDPIDDDEGSYEHYYGIATIVLLLVILYYVYNIRKELVGMYEEV